MPLPPLAPHPRQANASRICYELAKACFNRLRDRWTTSGWTTSAGPPLGHAHMASAQHGGPRTPDAQRLLEALRVKGASPGPATYLDNPDSINWASLAANTYKDFVSSGTRPSAKTLDKVLCCLRLKLQLEPDVAHGEHGLLQEMVRPPPPLPLLPPASCRFRCCARPVPPAC
jgi:hypothetical protein